MPSKSLEVKKRKPRVNVAVQGRPTLKTSELIEEICARIIGGQNIVNLCDAEDMPTRDSIHRWLATDNNFSDKYVRACHLRREYKFHEMERRALTVEDVNRARLLVDVVKWQLSKEDPKKYGDKMDVTSAGEKVVPILGVLSLPNTTDDIKREFIESEVPEKTALDPSTSKGNIMDDINS